jgi:ADP-ribosylglycohydrolase
MFGRGPLRYTLLPPLGIVSNDTHLMCAVAQAVLRSRGNRDRFAAEYAKRLRWYCLSLPWAFGWRMWMACLRMWFVKPEQAGVPAQDGGPLLRSLLLSAVLQGSGNKGDRWAETLAEATHSDPDIHHACSLVCSAGQIAVYFDHREFSPSLAIKLLIEETEDEVLHAMLLVAQECLEKQLSVGRAARRIARGSRPSNHCYHTAVLAIYAWLRNPHRFRRVVEPAILLGSEYGSLGALAGGLAGIHLGAKQIPPNWTRWLFGWPHGRRWLRNMGRRLSQWPHASEDLHSAPAMPGRWIGQVIRNLLLTIAVFGHGLVRLPCWLVGIIAHRQREQAPGRLT